MDPLTHVLSGLLVARALAPSEASSVSATRGARAASCVSAAASTSALSRLLPVPGRWRYLFCGFAAWMPDLDLLVAPLSGGGPAVSLLYHRGPSHSLVGAVVLGLALGWPVARFFRLSAKRMVLAATLLTLLHIFLDAATTYGTQVLWPFSRARLAFPALFIIDPIFTGSMLLLLLLSLTDWAARLGRVSGRSLAVCGVVLTLAWPLSSYATGRLVQASIAAAHPEEQVQVTTELLSPFWWKVVRSQAMPEDTSDTGRELRVGSVSILGVDGAETVWWDFFALPPGLWRALEEAGGFPGVYAWFLDLPGYARPAPAQGTKAAQRPELVLFDLRFISFHPWLRGGAGEREPAVITGESLWKTAPFRLYLRLDPAVGTLSYAYGKRNDPVLEWELISVSPLVMASLKRYAL